MSEKVKQRCTELLYGWSQVLPHEPKIKEAYQMLRRQGIVKQDPVYINQVKKNDLC
jgi:ADP-ribosylation factor-binding protein GGA